MQSHDSAIQVSRERAIDGAGMSRSVSGQPLAEPSSASLAELIGELVEAGGIATAPIGVTAGPQDTDAFFTIAATPGQLQLVLNSSHPIYVHLSALAEAEASERESTEALRQRLGHASALVRFLLLAWTRYELSERVGVRRDQVSSARRTWGKSARELLGNGRAEPLDLARAPEHAVTELPHQRANGTATRRERVATSGPRRNTADVPPRRRDQPPVTGTTTSCPVCKHDLKWITEFGCSVITPACRLCRCTWKPDAVPTPSVPAGP